MEVSGQRRAPAVLLSGGEPFANLHGGGYGRSPAPPRFESRTVQAAPSLLPTNVSKTVVRMSGQISVSGIYLFVHIHFIFQSTHIKHRISGIILLSDSQNFPLQTDLSLVFSL